MVPRIRSLVTIAALAALGWNVQAAPAQSTGAVPPGIITGRPSDNVASAGSRAPGNMVSAGVGRAVKRANGFFAPPEITQTAPPEPQTEFLLDALPILFEEFNRAVLALTTAIFAREGIVVTDFGPQLVNQIIGTALGSSSVGGLLQKHTEERLRTPALR